MVALSYFHYFRSKKEFFFSVWIPSCFIFSVEDIGSAESLLLVYFCIKCYLSALLLSCTFFTHRHTHTTMLYFFLPWKINVLVWWHIWWIMLQTHTHSCLILAWGILMCRIWKVSADSEWKMYRRDSILQGKLVKFLLYEYANMGNTRNSNLSVKVDWVTLQLSLFL